MTQNDFAFRIDRWTDDGERIVEHVAGAEDFQIAMATYHAARKRWPKAAMTLRQDTWVIEDAGVRELAPFFRSRGPRRAANAENERTKRTALVCEYDAAEGWRIIEGMRGGCYCAASWRGILAGQGGRND